MKKTTAVASLVAALSLADAAYAVPVFDQSALDRGTSFRINDQVVADDFSLAAATDLTKLVVYLADDAVNDNNTLDSFGGTLSWGFYADGGLFPGTLLFTGSDSSLVYADAGQDTSGADLLRVEADIVAPQTLQGDTIYWLAIHEGAWQSAADGSSVWWSKAAAGFDLTKVTDANESAPGSNWTRVGNDQVAFSLEGNPIPEPASLGLAAAGAFLLLLGRKRR